MNMSFTRFALHLLLIMALASVAFESAALESDRDQPIRIQADSALVDESGGSSIYRGNVSIVQGSLKLEAEEVEIFVTDSEVTQIIARAADEPGSLAQYQQLRESGAEATTRGHEETTPPNTDNNMVTAEARTITYLVQEERLHLAGDARLKQIRDEFDGELLYYDMKNGIVNLSASEGERVNMTITPRKRQE